MKILYYRILLLLSVLIASLFRFGYIYQDSIQYIWFAQYFAGMDILINPIATVADNMVVRAPFVYRPLLPLLAAVFSGGLNIAFIMSIINIIVLCVMTDMIFNICNTVGTNENMAFCGTLLTSLSYPLIYYGAVPLTDAFSMLCFVGLISCMELNYGDNYAALLIFIGVFIKEIILILGLFYVVRGGLKKVWLLFPGAMAALSLRLFIGLENTLVFGFDFLLRPTEIILMFGATFAIPVIIILYYWLRKDFGTKRGKRIFIAGLIAGLPLMFMGLFFAYFDGRFIWPLLITTGMYIATLGE